MELKEEALVSLDELHSLHRRASPARLGEEDIYEDGGRLEGGSCSQMSHPPTRRSSELHFH